MSTKYKNSEDVPTRTLAASLDDLSKAITKRLQGDASDMDREFTCRIPAELDRDPDLVLREAAKRLRELEGDARRYMWMRDNRTWRRYGKLADNDSCAVVECRFPYLANFDSKAMLDFNIDKMLERSSSQKVSSPY